MYYVRMVKKCKHSDLFPGALEVMILKSLKLEANARLCARPATQGYFQRRTIFHIEVSSLYPALQRMLKNWLAGNRNGALSQEPCRCVFSK